MSHFKKQNKNSRIVKTQLDSIRDQWRHLQLMEPHWKYGVGTGQLEGEFALSFIHLFCVDWVLERRQI